MKNRILWLSVGALILAVIVTVVLTTGHIKDTNGVSDKSLAIIDLDQRISEEDYTHQARLESSVKTGAPTGSDMSEIDFTSINYSVQKLSGVKVIHETYLNEGEELLITVSTEVEEGNAEIIIVSPSNQIVGRFTVHGFEQTIDVEGEVGAYRVVIGAESAHVSVAIRREIIAEEE